ncbi:hypothetical protein BJX64DRAFT_6243 [Aspergillus heterothallicus]
MVVGSLLSSPILRSPSFLSLVARWLAKEPGIIVVLVASPLARCSIPFGTFRLGTQLLFSFIFLAFSVSHLSPCYRSFPGVIARFDPTAFSITFRSTIGAIIPGPLVTPSTWFTRHGSNTELVKKDPRCRLLKRFFLLWLSYVLVSRFFQPFGLSFNSEIVSANNRCGWIERDARFELPVFRRAWVFRHR